MALGLIFQAGRAARFARTAYRSYKTAGKAYKNPLVRGLTRQVLHGKGGQAARIIQKAKTNQRIFKTYDKFKKIKRAYARNESGASTLRRLQNSKSSAIRLGEQVRRRGRQARNLLGFEVMTGFNITNATRKVGKDAKAVGKRVSKDVKGGIKTLKKANRTFKQKAALKKAQKISAAKRKGKTFGGGRNKIRRSRTRKRR